MNAVFELTTVRGENGLSRPTVTPECEAAVNRRLRPFGLDWRGFANWNRNWVREDEIPWALILFEDDLRLTGHVAELRGVHRNMPMLSYGRVAAGLHYGRMEVAPPFSSVFVRKKGILASVAAKSLLFAPAWAALKNRPHDRHWIYLSPLPPA